MIFRETNIIRRWKTKNMINTSIVWTLIAAVQLALVGTILLSILVTVQIAASYTTYTNNAPTLTLVPESAQQKGYEFVNGINGMGAFGFQILIATALPGDKGYSPIAI